MSGWVFDEDGDAVTAVPGGWTLDGEDLAPPPAPSTFTYVANTPIWKLRLLLADRDETNAIFRDDELTYFLAQNGGDVNLAGVAAYGIWIRDRTRLLKRTKNGTTEEERRTVQELLLLMEELKAVALANSTEESISELACTEHLGYLSRTWTPQCYDECEL